MLVQTALKAEQVWLRMCFSFLLAILDCIGCRCAPYSCQFVSLFLSWVGIAVSGKPFWVCGRNALNTPDPVYRSLWVGGTELHLATFCTYTHRHFLILALCDQSSGFLQAQRVLATTVLTGQTNVVGHSGWGMWEDHHTLLYSCTLKSQKATRTEPSVLNASHSCSVPVSSAEHIACNVPLLRREPLQ